MPLDPHRGSGLRPSVLQGTCLFTSQCPSTSKVNENPVIYSPEAGMRIKGHQRQLLHVCTLQCHLGQPIPSCLFSSVSIKFTGFIFYVTYITHTLIYKSHFLSQILELLHGVVGMMKIRRQADLNGKCHLLAGQLVKT